MFGRQLRLIAPLNLKSQFFRSALMSKSINDFFKPVKRSNIADDISVEKSRKAARTEENCFTPSVIAEKIEQKSSSDKFSNNSQSIVRTASDCEDVKCKGGSVLSDPEFDPLMFDISNYISSDGQITYQLLTDAFDEIAILKGSGQGSSIMIKNILCSMLRVLIVYSPQDIVPTLYLTLNKVAPDYESIELGLGDAIITSVISSAFNRTAADIKAEMAAGKATDLGEVAYNSRTRQNTLSFANGKQKGRLTIKGVFQQFKSIALTSGKGSQDAKKSDIQKMLLAAQGSEVKFLIRALQRKMRIGVASLSLLTSLSHAFVLSRPAHSGRKIIADIRNLAVGADLMSVAELDSAKKKFEAAVRAAYCEQPSLDHLVERLLAGDDAVALSKSCSIQIGIPVAPMLAKPTKGISEVLDRFTNIDFTCEFKYDGERAQVHYRKGKPLEVYSRNSENLTGKYPDLLEAIEEALKDSPAQSLVLDCEAVAYDTVNHDILPFQELIKRKKKDVKLEDIKIRVCLFAFDCMLVNDQSLLKTSFFERRAILRQHLKEIPGKFLYAIGTDVYLNKNNRIKNSNGSSTIGNVLNPLANMADSDDKVFDPSEMIQQALDAAVKGNCEGLMVKTLTEDATYEPSRRSFKWLKVKKDYVDGMTDSLDVVPIGAFYGRGKRAGTFGAYLLGVWNSDEGRYETCCKIGTGFTDEFLQEQTKYYNNSNSNDVSRILLSKPSNYLCPSELEPDVWLDCCQVWEIKGADMTLSPKHTAGIGLVNQEKGIAIRFPRFLRIRDDKDVEDITSNEQVADLYNAQFAHKKIVNYNDDSDFAE